MNQGCVPDRSRRPLGCAPSAMPTKSVCRCGNEKLVVVAGTRYGIVPKLSSGELGKVGFPLVLQGFCKFSSGELGKIDFPLEPRAAMLPVPPHHISPVRCLSPDARAQGRSVPVVHGGIRLEACRGSKNSREFKGLYPYLR